MTSGRSLKTSAFCISLGCYLLLPAWAFGAAVRGVAGDLWADAVLGQWDYTQASINTVDSRRVMFPRSCVCDNSDPAHPRLYVADTGNNRILGFSDTNGFTPNQGAVQYGWQADIVLGQPDFSRTGANGDSTCENSSPANYPLCAGPTAKTLASIWQGAYSIGEAGAIMNMAVDKLGNLYVPDYINNRVVRFARPSAGAQGPSAEAIWGQGDFNQNFPNQGNSSPSADSLRFYVAYNEEMVAGVGLDEQGNLWVADRGNGRVLRFPNLSGEAGAIPSQTADVVLGQDDFNTQVVPVNLQTDLTHLQYPVAVRVDSLGRVFVADNRSSGSSRFGCVLVYVPTGKDVTGRFSYGPMNRSLQPAARISDFLSRPTGLEFDSNTTTVTAGKGGIWVSDQARAQIVMYSESNPGSLSFACTKVLLIDQPVNSGAACAGSAGGDSSLDFTDGAGRVVSSWKLDTCEYGGGVGVDPHGGLFLAGYKFNEVVRFPGPIPTRTAGVAHSSDVMPFKEFQMAVLNTLTGDTLDGGEGLAIGIDHGVTQLVVSDVKKILFWNLPTQGGAGLAAHTPPDGFVSQQPATLYVDDVMRRIAADRAQAYGSPHSHVWALTNQWPGSDRTMIRRFDLPLVPGVGAEGISVCALPLPVLGGGAITHWSFQENGIAAAPDGSYLWATDRFNNRVFRIRNPMTNPVVDIILGQPSAASTISNYPAGAPSAFNLSQPGAVALDHQVPPNLYISDYSLEFYGNGRTLKYDGAAVSWTGNTALYSGGVNPQTGVTLRASRVFGTNGSFTTEGQGGGPLLSDSRTWGMAFNKDDTLMVAGVDGQVGRKFPVLLLNPLAGETVAANLNDMGAQPYSVEFDDQDNLYVLDHNWSRVLVYWGIKPNTLGGVTQCGCPSMNKIYQSAVSDGARPMAFGGGRIYVPDYWRREVVGYDLGGAAAVTYVDAVEPSGAAYWKNPRTGTEYVFVTLSGGSTQKIERWNVSTGLKTNPVPSSGFGNAFSIWAEADGGLWVGYETQAVHYLWDGGADAYSAAQTISSLNLPLGLLVVSGDLYVADNQRVLKYVKGAGGMYVFSRQVWSGPGTSLRQMAVEPGTNNVEACEYNGRWITFDMTDRCGSYPWTPLRNCNVGALNNGELRGIAVDGSQVYLSGKLAQNVEVARYPLPDLACFPSTSPTLQATPTIVWTLTPSPTPSPDPTGIPSPGTLTWTWTPTASPTCSWTASFTTTWTPTPTSTGTALVADTATLTPSPTSSFTQTPTATPTVEPTSTETRDVPPEQPCRGIFASEPCVYPNPASSGSAFVSLQLSSCRGGFPAEVSIWTTAYRKVREQYFGSVPAGGSRLQIPLIDQGRRPLAAGLYYLKMDIEGTSRIFPLVVAP